MDRVIEISNWRPKHIEAVITDELPDANSRHGYETAGAITIHLLADGERFRTTTLGPILRDSNGKLWVQFPESSQTHDDSRLAFLASDVERLENIAKLHVRMVQSGLLPRSQQNEHTVAERTYDDWVRDNDPQCKSDEGSFWNRMHDGDV